jgi:hypothetical protein
MSDGAVIRVGGTLMSDRTGHVYGYNERIAPDEYVPTEQDFNKIGADNDRVVRAAVKWLKEQAPCAR